MGRWAGEAMGQDRSSHRRYLNGSFGRILLVAALYLAGMPLVSPEIAFASSRACIQLERQLVASRPSGGSSRQAKRYAKAVRAQQRQIRIVHSRMNKLGCARKKSFFKRERHASCGPLRNSLAKMASNLNRLKRRSSGPSGGSSEAQRRRIKRQLARNGCLSRRADRKSASVIDRIFGRRKQRRRASADPVRPAKAPRQVKTAIRKRDDNAKAQSYSSVRTMCVRTCDGYYFPVSFSAERGSFEAASAACQRLCPGTEIKLFYHSAAGESADDLVSVANDRPYSSLENAFAYRRSFNRNCSCNHQLANKPSQGHLQIVAGNGNRKAVQDAKPISLRLSLPLKRPDLTADPETLANRRGGLTEDVLGRLGARLNGPMLAQQRGIRTVGAAFLPSR